MKLVKLDPTYRTLLYELMEEWSKERQITPWAVRRIDYKSDFDLYLESLENGFKTIKESTFFLLDEDENRFIGAVNIRHELNEMLLLKTGHIGYGLRPSARGKGYAKTMLKLALDECLKLGITKVLVICDRDNLPSKHTILSCGGVLENEIVYEGHNM